MRNSEFEKVDNKSFVPTSVAAARWFFILLGVIWLIFGVWRVARIGDSSGNISNMMLGAIGVLMFVNALLLLWLGWGIGKGQRLYYYFGVIVLAGNIYLTLTDEFGLYDLVVLALTVGLLILLILTRSRYLTN